MQNTQRGFTLIELLVVIAIIGLLASIVMASLSNARMKARDAQRIAEFNQLSTALQLYAGDHGGNYPICANLWIYSADSSGSWSCLVTALAPYIKVPIDPINNTAGPHVTGNYSFEYLVSPNGQDYDLIGQLEDPTNPMRCQVKNWSFHYYGTGPAYSLCTTYSYSPYLFEDH